MKEGTLEARIAQLEQNKTALEKSIDAQNTKPKVKDQFRLEKEYNELNEELESLEKEVEESESQQLQQNLPNLEDEAKAEEPQPIDKVSADVKSLRSTIGNVDISSDEPATLANKLSAARAKVREKLITRERFDELTKILSSNPLPGYEESTKQLEGALDIAIKKNKKNEKDINIGDLKQQAEKITVKQISARYKVFAQQKEAIEKEYQDLDKTLKAINDEEAVAPEVDRVRRKDLYKRHKIAEEKLETLRKDFTSLSREFTDLQKLGSESKEYIESNANIIKDLTDSAQVQTELDKVSTYKKQLEGYQTELDAAIQLRDKNKEYPNLGDNLLAQEQDLGVKLQEITERITAVGKVEEKLTAIRENLKQEIDSIEKETNDLNAIPAIKIATQVKDLNESINSLSKTAEDVKQAIEGQPKIAESKAEKFKARLQEYRYTKNDEGKQVDLFKPFKRSWASNRKAFTWLTDIGFPVSMVGWILVCTFAAAQTAARIVNMAVNLAGTVVEYVCKGAATALDKVGQLLCKPFEWAAEKIKLADAGEKMGPKVGWRVVAAVMVIPKILGGSLRITASALRMSGDLIHEVAALGGKAALIATKPWDVNLWKDMMRSVGKVASHAVGAAAGVMKQTGTEIRGIGNGLNIPIVRHTLGIVGALTQSIAAMVEGMVEGTRQILSGNKELGVGLMKGGWLTFIGNMKSCLDSAQSEMKQHISDNQLNADRSLKLARRDASQAKVEKPVPPLLQSPIVSEEHKEQLQKVKEVLVDKTEGHGTAKHGDAQKPITPVGEGVGKEGKSLK